MFLLQPTWDAVREMERMQQEFDQLFSGFSGAVHAFPALNVWTRDNAAVVTAELPGMSAEDVEIRVQNDVLALQGERKPLELKDGDVLLRNERIAGRFSRALRLPFRVDAEKVGAQFKNGVLTITLPRAQEDLPRKIAVQGA